MTGYHHLPMLWPKPECLHRLACLTDNSFFFRQTLTLFGNQVILDDELGKVRVERMPVPAVEKKSGDNMAVVISKVACFQSTIYYNFYQLFNYNILD